MKSNQVRKNQMLSDCPALIIKGFNVNKLKYIIGKIPTLFLTIIVSLFSTLVSSATFENEHKVGDVTIHYNVFNSSRISAEVASLYGITRSGQTGLINISVIKNEKPVIANIFGHGKNLAGQLKSLAFKEIKEENAIYYIATFTFRSAEDLIFELQVQPEKSGILIPLKFKQQLFID